MFACGELCEGERWERVRESVKECERQCRMQSCGMFIYSEAVSSCKHDVGMGKQVETNIERERDRERVSNVFRKE